ncbi:MAG: hypothetical protein IJE07_11500 [Clostridia bacterium]|nr:hypothetical protein [Clostridia bacterium]
MRRRHSIFMEESHRGRAFLSGLGVLLLLLVAGLFTWNLALNHTVTYEKTYVTIAGLPDSLENFSILHLSDLNGAYLGENQSALRKVLEGKSPSCVVLSGNMVGPEGEVEAVLEMISIFPTGTTVLLLPGDDDPALYAREAHASLSPYAPWAAKLQEAGVLILDEPRAITRGSNTVWFIPEGLYTLDLENSLAAWQAQVNTLSAIPGELTQDEAAQLRSAQYQVERLKRIGETLASIRDKDVQIMVTHMPLTKEYVTSARQEESDKKTPAIRRVSLVLAGGYCGGQWRIPGVGAIWAPELGFFPEDHLVQGLSYVGGVWQHISPGLGVSERYPLLPFRMFNSPVTTLVVLTGSVK